jgi:hypothetical protein
LVDQDKNRIAVNSQACSENKKIPQMSAKDEHSGAFFERGVEMLAPDDRHLEAKFLVGSFEHDADFHTIAEKISERPARNLFDSGVAHYIAKRPGDIARRSPPKA